MNIKERILFVAVSVLAVILVISVIYFRFFERTKIIVKTEYREIPKIVERIKTVRVPIKEIVVIDKKEAKKKIEGLPGVIDKPEKQITTTGKVEPYEGTTNVIAVIDTSTGESEIFAKKEPLPFIKLLDEKEIGIRVGIGTSGTPVDIFGRWTFGRIGKVHTAIYTEGTSNINNIKPEGKVAFELSVRW